MESLGASRARTPERYLSLIKLASGGTATVYAGLDVKTGELVALKRPHEHLASDPTFLRSLRAEIDIASRIVHPNVVSIIDVDQTDDVIHLVMPYVRGASLSELLVAASRAHPVRPEVSLRIIADACAGLHAAHELHDQAGKLLGLVHRDVSPHNLMVGADGVTRVTDFGIAKSVDAHTEHSTTTGVLKGKFAYMAPEYIRGAPIDRRADLFALGVVLWEALAGERLFKGSNQIESSRLVLEKAAPSLGTIAPDLARFDPLISMALEKQPAERVPTAKAWLEAIERFPLAAHEEVARTVQELVGDALAERQAMIQKRLLVMAEITQAGTRPPRDTLRMTTGFDPEDLAPTLVIPLTTEISGVQVAQTQTAAQPASRPELAEPASPEISAAPPSPEPSVPPSRRRVGWVVAGVLGLASAGVSIAVLHARQQTSRAAEPTAEAPAPPASPPPTTTPAPPASVTANVIDTSVVDITSLPRPSATPRPSPSPPASSRLVRTSTSASSPPPQPAPPTSSEPSIIRHVDLGARPNPYAK